MWPRGEWPRAEWRKGSWREPHFWHANQPGLWSKLLAPLGTLYGQAVRLRYAVTDPLRVPAPVICVGNPGLGGGGKTPTTIAVTARLLAFGEYPHILTRGYGGRLVGPVTVDPDHHAAADVGDEPLLIAAHAPVHVAADRRAGARHAVAAGATVLVMDDGYQNPSLVKDLSLLVIDGAAGIGNGQVFPAGPLREPIGLQLDRADAVVIVGPGEAGDQLAATAGDMGVAVLRARLITSAAAPDLSKRDVVAVSGIARPEKFTTSLEATGARIVASRIFPDHHLFTRADVAEMLSLADAHRGSMVVMTEKDRVRLGPDNDPGEVLRWRTITLPVEMRFDDPESLDDLLRSTLKKLR